jgi:hypothetical protein
VAVPASGTTWLGPVQPSARLTTSGCPTPATTAVPTGGSLGTAAVVVEVVSPDDETFAKFDFFLAHGAEELVVADPATKALRWWVRGDAGFEPAERSGLLGVDVAEIAGAIDWP